MTNKIQSFLRNILLLITVVLLIQITGCAEEEGDEGEDYSIYPCDVVDMKKGPYLQNVGTDRITIMWETEDEAPSTVHYGRNPEYNHSISEEANTLIHEVTLTGLKRETLYHYRVVSENICSLGKTFQTAVKRDTPFSFVVYGDCQTNSETPKMVAEAIIEADPDLIIMVGDLVSNGEVYEQWDTQFFGPARDLFDHIPVFAAIGNHENNAHWFYDFFSFPPPENYYAFPYGNSYFIVVDTNFPYVLYDEQYHWLEERLNSEEAKEADWIFSFNHQPAYTEGWGHPGYDGEFMVRLMLVTLEEEYGVDMVFNGHTHGYERGMLNGVHRIIAGGCGGGLDSFQQDFEHVIVSEYVHHYVHVTIKGRELSLEARQPDGTIIDSFEISK